MPYNGSGVFVRVYNWVSDAAGGIPITASRVDTEDDGIATGLSTAVCKDGQTTITANLPMSTFRHTGVGNAVARTDYAAAGQIQDGGLNWVIAGGTSDALTATYSPAVTALVDGMLLRVRATAANGTTTPTFSPNGLTAHTVTKKGGTALAIADVSGAGHELFLAYNLAGTRWELLNPATIIPGPNSITNAMLAQMTANTIKGNNTGSTANATDIALTASTFLGMGSSGNIAALTAGTGLAIGASSIALTFTSSPITNSLSGDVSLNNTANYFDGPSIAQGSTGTWLAEGTVTIQPGGVSEQIFAKLWDGTTVISSCSLFCPNSGVTYSLALSGYLATPAGNLRISVRDSTGTSGLIKFNATGNSKDSTISAIRIA